MKRKYDISIGTKFGKLTTTSEVNRNYRVDAKCECGDEYTYCIYTIQRRSKDKQCCRNCIMTKNHACKKYFWKGEERSIPEIAQLENLSVCTLRQRLKRLPLDVAVTKKPYTRSVREDSEYKEGKRKLKLYMWYGHPHSISEIAARSKVPEHTIRYRLKRCNDRIDIAVHRGRYLRYTQKDDKRRKVNWGKA
jgi:hypothetical protein